MSKIRTNRDAIVQIRDRQAFENRTGSLSAEWTAWPNYGWAPESVRNELREAIGYTLDAAVESGTFPPKTSRVYVVFSYWTPIAYAVKGGPLVVFDAKYSVTTSKHQGIVRQAA